jgi:hypothetical protein
MISMLLTLLFTYLAFYRWVWTFRERFMLYCPNLYLSQSHFFRDLHKIWCTISVPLSDPSRNRTGQIHDSKWKDVKNQHLHSTAWNYVHWLPRYTSTVIYRHIALLQLLQRWQHQFRKLSVLSRILRVVRYFTFCRHCVQLNKCRHTLSKQLYTRKTLVLNEITGEELQQIITHAQKN